MKVILTVGHSVLKNGTCTSADGRPFGGVLEYAYNKGIVGKAAAYLRSAGHEADVLLCPENEFKSSAEEKGYKLPRVNGGGYDLVAELHLNASVRHDAAGCEVLYLSEKGKAVAQRIQGQLATTFKDRGIQRRPNLYMLNSTVPTAVMIESFFCDNPNDCKLAKNTDVALLIAEGIHGGRISGRNQDVAGGGIYRVQTGAFSDRKNAERLAEKLKKKGFDAFVTPKDQKGICRVQVGAYSIRGNALAMEKVLRKAGFEALIVQEQDACCAP